MSLLNFDASKVAPATGELEPIPVDWYNVVMDQSENKPTKDAAQTGNFYLETRFNIMDGKYAGRKLFSRMNLRHGNPVTVEIAQKELSAICHATGVLQVQDSQQLHGIPLKVKVKIVPAEGQYSAKNEITAYRNITFVPDAPVGALGTMAPGAMPPAVGIVPPPVQPQQQWAAPPAAAQPPQQWQQPQQPQQPAQPPAQAPQQWQAPPMQPQQPAQAPGQPWAPTAGQQPWAAQQPQQPQQPPQWQQPQQPQQVAPPAQPQQPPQQTWQAGAPNDPQMQPPPWQRPA